MTDTELILQAARVRELAYAPYSDFKVGAALLCRDGTVYTGCNIENASFGATNCAERTALFKAVSEGQREFEAVAIVGYPEEAPDLETFCFPCGICRQVFAEFCEPDFRILVRAADGTVKTETLDGLLPSAFTLED